MTPHAVSARPRLLRLLRPRPAARHAQGGRPGPWAPSHRVACSRLQSRRRSPMPPPSDLQELGGLARGSERAAANGAGREEIDAALRTEKETREKLLREKDAELEELRALLRSKPARDPAVGTDPAPALVPAPAEDRTLADAVWPPGWVE